LHINPHHKDAELFISDPDIGLVTRDGLVAIRDYWFNQWNFVDGTEISRKAFDHAVYHIDQYDKMGAWDTSKVTNMKDMFKNCTALTNIDLSGWHPLGDG